MEPVVIVRGGWAYGRCVRLPEIRQHGGMGRTVMIFVLAAGIEFAAGWAEAQAQSASNPVRPPKPLPMSLVLRESRNGLNRPVTKAGSAAAAPAPDSTTRLKLTARVPVAPALDAAQSAAKRFRIRDESGHCVVARLHGQC